MCSRGLVALLCVAAAGSFGCVQRALLLPVLEPALAALTTVSRPTGRATALVDGAGATGAAKQPGAVRFVIHSADSTLDVHGGDLLTGMHLMQFRRWRGAFVIPADGPRERPTGRLTIDIELDSLETDSVVDISLRGHLLEVDRFPRAIFAGTFQPRADGQDGYVFQGRLALHGQERTIRFYGSLQRTKDGYRIGSEFDMSRDAFAMHRKDALDLVIYDDFRVLFDLAAHPEHVEAEVITP